MARVCAARWKWRGPVILLILPATRSRRRLRWVPKFPAKRLLAHRGVRAVHGLDGQTQTELHGDGPGTREAGSGSRGANRGQHARLERAERIFVADQRQWAGQDSGPG